MKTGNIDDLLQKIGTHSNEDLIKMSTRELVTLSEEYLGHLKDIIHLQEKEIKQHEIKEAIVLLGETGSGKSTIINYLNGIYGKINLSGLKKPIIDFHHTKDALTVSKSDSYSSCTFLPQIKVGNNILFLDFPGTKDNRGFFVNVFNGLIVRNMVNYVDTIKVCLVIEYTSLDVGRGVPFQKSISDNILNIIKSDNEQNVSLIVNKVPNELTLEDVEEIITSAEYNNHKVKEFISNLIHNKKIAIFSSPAEDEKDDSNIGRVYYNELVSAQIKDMEQLLFHTTKSIPANSLESWPVDRDVLSQIFDAYKNELKIDIDSKKKKYWDEVYKLNNEIALEYLRKKIREDINSIEDLYKMEDNTLETIRKQLEFLGNGKDIENITLLEPLLQDDTCQEMMRKGVTKQYLHPFQNELRKIFKYIEDVNVRELSQGQNKEKIVYGNFIDANKCLMHHADGEIKSIKFYATNYVILRNSIQLQGISLTVVTPNLSIEGNISINLGGRNGIDHKEPKAEGRDGLPGNPGQSSGNLLLVYKHAYNLEGAKFLLYGGKGGNGQDGGDGNNGRHGTDAKEFLLANDADIKHNDEEKNLLLNEDYQIREVLFNSKFVNKYSQSIQHDIDISTVNCCYCCIPKYIVKTHTFLIKGMPGKKGQDAFKGGQVGKDGEDGTLTIINEDIDDIKVFLNKDVNNFTATTNGKHGIPGKGGTNGKHYAIQYKIPEDYYSNNCGVIDFLTLGFTKLAVHLLAKDMQNSETQKELNAENTRLGTRYAGGNLEQEHGGIPDQFNTYQLQSAEKNPPIDKNKAIEEYQKIINELDPPKDYYDLYLNQFCEEHLKIPGHSIDYSQDMF